MFVTIPKLIQYCFPSVTWKQTKAKKKLWLTFDDGPTPEVTPYILTILKETKIKATFFLVGKEIESYPELFKLIISEGHSIANHSYSHLNGWMASTALYLKDVEKCQKLMPNNKLYRPPYGKLGITQIQKLKKKYKLILWDVLSLDFKNNISPEKIKRNVLNNVQNGSIIVLDGKQNINQKYSRKQ